MIDHDLAKWKKHKDGFRYIKKNWMTVVCAWCGFETPKEKKVKNCRQQFESKIKEGVSHWLCPQCHKIQDKKNC